jgi:hypothetical protein
MNSIRLTPFALCLALVFLPAQNAPLAAEAADAFDCAACHPTKIRDFKGRRANPVTPVEEFPELATGKQNSRLRSSPSWRQANRTSRVRRACVSPATTGS